MNNTAPDSQTNKRFTNLLTALPFLFLQSSAFDKLQLRERSENFKNLMIEGKNDDIGNGSPSYTHHGNDALAEGNVDADGDNDGFPPPTFDMSIFRHVILTKV